MQRAFTKGMIGCLLVLAKHIGKYFAVLLRFAVPGINDEVTMRYFDLYFF